MIYKDAEVLAQMLYSLSMFAVHSVADCSGSVDAQVGQKAACVPAVPSQLPRGETLALLLANIFGIHLPNRSFLHAALWGGGLFGSCN